MTTKNEVMSAIKNMAWEFEHVGFKLMSKDVRKSCLQVMKEGLRRCPFKREEAKRLYKTFVKMEDANFYEGGLEAMHKALAKARAKRDGFIIDVESDKVH